MINHTAAQGAAESGMDRSGSHANQEAEGWVEEAAEALGWAATQHPGSEFTIEQLRQLTAGLTEPPDLRAWGAATRRATRQGFLVKTSGFALAASSNNSFKPLYIKGIWR